MADPAADRKAARQERKARAQRQYELLEQARRERHSRMRSAIGDATRLRRPDPTRDSESAEQETALAGPRGLPSRRTMLVLLLIVVIAGVIFALIGGGDDNNSPPLATSCTTPAVAIGAQHNSDNLRYSITGPAAGTYVVAIDAATARVRGDGVDLTPAGATAIAIKQNLKDCKGNGALPSAGVAGHELAIFRDGKIVARAKIPG
jgi:hypothetical protein